MTAKADNDRSSQEEAPPEAAPESPEVETSPEEETPEPEPGSQAAELRTKWLRAQADYQNLKRRAASDLERGVRRRLQPLLDELLLVMDYLDMALAAPVESPEAKNLAIGVEMTRTKLLQALEHEEVHAIDTDGPFDPEVHEAAETRPAEGVEPGSILAVVRKGYSWRDVILRHAQVVVAEGPQEGAQEEGTPTPKEEGPGPEDAS